MRAVEYDQYGDTEVLHMADRPIPQRLLGQLMIQGVGIERESNRLPISPRGYEGLDSLRLPTSSRL